VLSNAFLHHQTAMPPLAKPCMDALASSNGHYDHNPQLHWRPTGARTTAHSDLYRAAPRPFDLIPHTTGAAKTLGKVMPELDGLIGGYAIPCATPTCPASIWWFELSQRGHCGFRLCQRQPCAPPLKKAH